MWPIYSSSVCHVDEENHVQLLQAHFQTCRHVHSEKGINRGNLLNRNPGYFLKSGKIGTFRMLECLVSSRPGKEMSLPSTCQGGKSSWDSRLKKTWEPNNITYTGVEQRVFCFTCHIFRSSNHCLPLGLLRKHFLHRNSHQTVVDTKGKTEQIMWLPLCLH